MSAILPSIRPRRTRPSPFNHLSSAFFVLGALLATAAPKAEAEYTFTLVADSAGAFSNFGSVPSPSLNSTGTVAFYAALDNGRYGIFSGNGTATTTIELNPQQRAGYGHPTINEAGSVAFYELQGNVNSELIRIVSGNGGPLTTIADTAGQFRDFAGQYSVSINASGFVAFWASQDSGPAGIFAGNGGVTTPVLINSASLSANSGIAMNDAGTVAFRNSIGTGIFTISGGLVTTIVDSSGPLNYFGSAPSLNEVGTVAFVAGVGGIDGGSYGIYSGNGGPLTTIADVSGPFSAFPSFSFGNPPINDSGTVAFIAGLDAGGAGIFTGDGTATNEVIGIGDTLFGSTVATFNISPTSLNDSGQVAFYYRLTNGTTGIAIATPTPEPSPTLLLALSLGLRLARRTRR